MSRHDQMMRLHAVPMLFRHFGDDSRVVVIQPGDTPQRIPLDVAGVGPIQADDVYEDRGVATSRDKIERVVISLELASVIPAVSWTVELDGDTERHWTIDRTSTSANGAVNIHCSRAQPMSITRRGLEAR